MKKFEEEFDNLIRAFIDYHDCFDFDTEKYYLELKKEFIEKYGKKQQPEIPEFVAKAVMEINLGYLFNGFTNGINKKAKEWLEKHKGAKSLGYYVCQLRFQGFTVAKEKRFYLKHIEMSKRDVHHDYYAQIRNERFEHDSVETGTLPQPVITGVTFTQQEIDSMETGSYEQIEVGE